MEATNMNDISKNYTTSIKGTPKSNIEINKYVGNKKVIDTGVLISYNSEEIIIVINSVQLRIKFLEDSSVTSEENITISSDSTMKNASIISLYNMKNILPEGTPSPLHIANVGEKKIFISFFVLTVSKEFGARMFQYTLLEGE